VVEYCLRNVYSRLDISSPREQLRLARELNLEVAGQLSGLELRHRRYARVEERIRHSKATDVEAAKD
jgi:hypothetical protein